MIRIILAVLALVALASSAEARQKHKTYIAHERCNIDWPCEGVSPSVRGERIARSMGFGAAQKVYTPRVSAKRPPIVRQMAAQVSDRVASAIVAHPPGCPSRAFCGCGAAVRVFGSPIRSLWLASAWFKFPRSEPAAGMVAVRRHHVFVLEAHLGGNTWQVYDANSGGRQTRVHARSLAGYTVVNPRGIGA